MNANVLEVFPGDVDYLFYAAEALSKQVGDVDIETQHAQPFLHAHLHNRIYHAYKSCWHYQYPPVRQQY